MVRALGSSISGLAQRTSRRDVSAVEVIETVLADVDRRGEAAGCYITVAHEQARARAAYLDTLEGPMGRLHGIPISVKDCLATAGIRTTAGSPLLIEHTPTKSARVVELLENAGAIVFAKDNMYDFAYCGPNPAFGDAVNPWGADRTCGGSSSGSASAVAHKLSLGALGTDGGGSIRMPSAFCGTVGLKPTNRLVDGEGEFPVQGSVSCIGPIANDVTDAALLFDVITEGAATQGVAASGRSTLRGIRLAVPECIDGFPVDSAVRHAFHASLAQISDDGGEVSYARFPSFEQARAAMWVITGAEYAEALSPYIRTRPEMLHPLTRTLLERSEYIPATAYVRAQRARRRLAEEMRDAMTDVDIIVLPTVPHPAYIRTDDRSPHGNEHPLTASTLFTAIFNITGQPAITLPCGRSEEGLPTGLQLVGRPFADSSLIDVATRCETLLAVV